MRILATLPLLAAGGLLSASAASDVQPGQWESTATITAVEGEGLPPGMADMIIGQVQTTSYCMTQEEIDAGPEAMFDQSDGQCKYTNFDMGGGTLNASAVCTTPQGSMQMEMTGTYTATTYESANTMVMSTPMGAMTMRATQSGKRTGACTG